ncbi:MAG: hypothetical protein D3924_00405 [Candidatus Electrothrix sp. AR4]|nr:hypothetical protein [Candidatus Electrothrix sp. AR4]
MRRTSLLIKKLTYIKKQVNWICCGDWIMNRSNTDKYQSYRVLNPLLWVAVLIIGLISYLFRPTGSAVIMQLYKHGSYNELIKYAEKNNLQNNSKPDIIWPLAASYCIEGKKRECSNLFPKADQLPPPNFMRIKSLYKDIRNKYSQDKNKRNDKVLLRLSERALGMYEQDYKKNGLDKKNLSKALEIAWTQTNAVKIIWLKRKLEKEKNEKTKNALKKIILTLYRVEKRYEELLDMLNPLKKREDYENAINIYQEWGRFEDAVEVYIRAYEQFDDIALLKNAYYLADAKGLQEKTKELLLPLSLDQKAFALRLAEIENKEGNYHAALEVYIRAYEKFDDIALLENAYYLADAKGLQEKTKELLKTLSIDQEKFALKLAEIENKEGNYHAAMSRYYAIWQRWKNEQALKAAYFIAQEHTYRIEIEIFLFELYEHSENEEYCKILAHLFTEEKNIQKLKGLIEEHPNSQHAEYINQSLAYLYFQDKNYNEALKYHWISWNKWKKLSALEGAYASSIALNKMEKSENLLHLLYNQTKKREYLNDLKEIHKGKPKKIAELLKKYPDYQEGRSLLSILYIEKNEYSKAEQQLLLLIKQYPDNLDYLHRIARLYIDTDQAKKAYPFCERLYLQDQKYADMYFYAAEKIGGEIYLNALKKKWEKHADEKIGFKLAVLHYDNEHYMKAINILQELIQQNNKIKYQLKLGYAYEKNGDPQKKIALLKNLPIKEMPPDVVLGCADMHIREGHWQEAVSMLNQWIKKRSDDSNTLPVLKHLAYIYNRMGKKDFFLRVNRRMEKIIIAELQIEPSF